jgi:hypothetical protein
MQEFLSKVIEELLFLLLNNSFLLSKKQIIILFMAAPAFIVGAFLSSAKSLLNFKQK